MLNLLNYNRYMYIHLNSLSISVKLANEGVIIDAWKGDQVIATEFKMYQDFGLEMNEVKT